MGTDGYNPALHHLGRRLRLAVIGGGPGSFIGGMHRQAARLTDCYELVAAALSSNPERARQGGKDLGLSEDRIYTDGLELIRSEVARDNGAEVVAIMTPNDSHFIYAAAAMKGGLDVICDKPMTNTLDEAEKLVDMVAQTGRIFRLTHNYTGYPLVRQAKAMVEQEELGEIRLIQIEYVQGGKADESKADPTGANAPWRYRVEKGGPSLVMGDIGTHAHNLIRYVTGLEVAEVAAEAGAIVPNRLIDDYAGAMLRMNNGARGSFWVTQAAAGVENSLQFRISGTKGTLEWGQEVPQRLTFKPLGRPAEVRTPNGPGTLMLSAYASHIVAGHPEGFPDGFANIYRDAAEAIAAKRAGVQPRGEAMTCPDEKDGLASIRFVTAVLKSSELESRWVGV
ncbi:MULTISPECIES: Gfo/Idh/MocA family protein [Desulfosediminicola]|uniref:Gfo/Idh/MocA family protein n=1 Tax=Desulfosediminicola TaxID=2886823 RepID=UPI0010AD5ADE|nr:Gfo/Idh/MocA family oxidoreductase [Desulfosediminicola ganghwensis]